MTVKVATEMAKGEVTTRVVVRAAAKSAKLVLLRGSRVVAE